MNLNDWHVVFVSVCIMAVLAAFIPLVMAYLPSRSERFFALAVLGENVTAEQYYPEDDPNLEAGQGMRWNVYLHNHMGETQYVAVRVKLLNSTLSAPNSTSCTPSPAPVVYEFRRFLLGNETWLFPLSWSILNVEQVGNFIDITSIYINGEVIDTNMIALNGIDYRMILELWIYDEDLNDFRFGWGYGDETRCAWNQIWFNVASGYVS